MSVNYTEKAVIINKAIQDVNKATQQKLFYLLLVLIGAVFGWLLCYFFPLPEHHSLLIGNLN
ncbi:hypothetical protein [Mucilaginibacter arboris]|uniref:Uncharacterized protein n=1 Tax=Mucilaginibacter arboris TaxID=2682090 RepID=A0A7K1T0G8_9SPHI|nr:hypothetical protein [Mucilaginibacter arboris]MVN22770.1 hypothetical protein [Mucilaginibacter arboris]